MGTSLAGPPPPVGSRPVDDVLSPAEAADVLNVSVPAVVNLLDGGLIPSEATGGNHRRIRRADVLAYRARLDADRRAVADELAAEGQRLAREFGLKG